MHDSLDGGRASGVAFIVNRSIQIDSGTVTLRLPFERLTLKWGGAGNIFLFISHPDYPGWTILSRNGEILPAIISTAPLPLQKKFRSIASEKRQHRYRAFAWIALIALCIWGSTALWQPFVSSAANYIPKTWERKLGDFVFSNLIRDGTIIDDAEIEGELTQLLAPLVTVADGSGYTFEFHIKREEDLNAFALPGGIIVIHSATILRADRPEEVLGVLAHEISHVTRRHTTKQLISVFGVYLVFDFIFGNLIGTIAALGDGAEFLLQQGFSREHESDADAQGLEYLHKAGIDPMGMVEFFQKIESESAERLDAKISNALSFLNTHPAVADRIQTLTTTIRAQNYSYTPMPLAPFKAFQAKLRNALQ
jgi:predicted Zn-dependent protease